MSFSASLEPGPILLGAMYVQDQDGNWLIDCTANLLARGTTLQSIGTPIINAYVGNHYPATGDMTVTNVAVLTQFTTNPTTNITVSPYYGFTFKAQTNGTVVNYYEVGFPLTLASGDVITRWCRIPIQTNLG